jgi:hypothetical protein
MEQQVDKLQRHISDRLNSLNQCYLTNELLILSPKRTTVTKIFGYIIFPRGLSCSTMFEHA